MPKLEELRPPQDILRVVETLKEGRALLYPLLSRQIGGIVVKGVAKGPLRDFWGERSELRAFAYEATHATRGYWVGDFRLFMRRAATRTVTPSLGPIITFHSNTPMHIDGEYYQAIDDEDNVSLKSRKPLFVPELYPGVSHHITRSGKTTFVMDRLSKYVVAQITKAQPRNYRGVTDTNKRDYPMRGEAVDLEAGDYVVAHTFGIHGQPMYIHGTTNSSPDRNSIIFDTYVDSEDIYIEDIPESITPDSVADYQKALSI